MYTVLGAMLFTNGDDRYVFIGLDSLLSCS